ncbi:universal stress protein [Catellatospora bangladeshensis]|uniref:Universal stress protein n=1 Tax=Catellatospora bangladeshensis TaxID=310355 RepID=A0A8J3NM11_9ACTN|nr:universal stress protein [Catellatospora bangladeshensis]GIF84613.1 universal stress protein [Catellatospora bangladeshensis]
MDPDTAQPRAAGRDHPVIAGVDGSECSMLAAHYAARLARERNAPLELVCGYQSALYGFSPPWLGGEYLAADQGAARQAAEEALAGVTSQVREQFPDLEVRSHLKAGAGAPVLIEESRRAALLVVGSRGAGGFTGLLLGSVSSQVAAHAHTTVVVFRPTGADADSSGSAATLSGPVMVGYDGSPTAQAALTFAAREALLRHTTLILVNIHWQAPWYRGDKPAIDPVEAARAEAEQLLADAIAPWRAEHAELAVELRPVHSLNAEHALIDASKDAALTVVGSRGRGGFTGMLLGSVSHALVEHAHSPVAVVHTT